MNGRIIELARQATGKQVVGASDLGNWDVIEKLSKLIIQECCDVVRYVDAVEIKKHFGVE